MLLLFVRIITPDKLVLELHAHHHTTDKHAPGDDELKVEQKHTHCPTEHLFNSSFYYQQTPQPALIVSYTTNYQVNFRSVWKFTFPNIRQHRGPPVA